MNITSVKIEKVLDLSTKEKDISKLPYKSVKWFEIDNKGYFVSEYDLASYIFNRMK